MSPVEMPKANENLTEATLERWLVQEGQRVAAEEPLCTIITDKASFELPAPMEGTVCKLFGGEKSVLPVGYILCAIGRPGEPLPETYEEQNRRTLETHCGAVTATAAYGAGAGGKEAGGAGASLEAPKRVRATPAARRLAKEAGVDLAELAKALDLRGPVGEKDVKAYLERRG